MSLITKEEVLKIARMSQIALTEEEVLTMQSHLHAVLSYASRVQDLSRDEDATVTDNLVVGVEREDVVAQADPEPIRAQSPEREGDYFIVPVIIETNQ